MTSKKADLKLNTEVLNIIYEKATECFNQANTFFGNTFLPATCNLKQRGRAAGTAHLHKNELRFNVFMYQQNPKEFLETVVPHEVAHIIVYQIYGDNVRPHGKEWQAVMLKVYGIEPSRTHSFDVPPLKETFEYHCSCQKHQFSKQRHTRAQRGTEYVCKGCRSTLQFSESDK
ncbi:SprT family zinc-dependent metalloprotease [Marinomonas profundimaris]|uniref:SprT n=1 Tax=Marinomonas profundimaris TaxID=1208321 RepID=W1RQW5_9GAMM|nr:SprT family zinc-dependent metalloprotease [Marinomonas profundimaris]ETI57899.1 sprT [Marinomonas profundimaris]